jgi:hypothetical protein
VPDNFCRFSIKYSRQQFVWESAECKYKFVWYQWYFCIRPKQAYVWRVWNLFWYWIVWTAANADTSYPITVWPDIKRGWYWHLWFRGLVYSLIFGNMVVDSDKKYFIYFFKNEIYLSA